MTLSLNYIQFTFDSLDISGIEMDPIHDLCWSKKCWLKLQVCVCPLIEKYMCLKGRAASYSTSLLSVCKQVGAHLCAASGFKPITFTTLSFWMIGALTYRATSLWAPYPDLQIVARHSFSLSFKLHLTYCKLGAFSFGQLGQCYSIQYLASIAFQ